MQLFNLFNQIMRNNPLYIILTTAILSYSILYVKHLILDKGKNSSKNLLEFFSYYSTVTDLAKFLGLSTSKPLFLDI